MQIICKLEVEIRPADNLLFVDILRCLLSWYTVPVMLQENLYYFNEIVNFFKKWKTSKMDFTKHIPLWMKSMLLDDGPQPTVAPLPLPPSPPPIPCRHLATCLTIESYALRAHAPQLRYNSHLGTISYRPIAYINPNANCNATVSASRTNISVYIVIVATWMAVTCKF